MKATRRPRKDNTRRPCQKHDSEIKPDEALTKLENFTPHGVPDDLKPLSGKNVVSAGPCLVIRTGACRALNCKELLVEEQLVLTSQGRSEIQLQLATRGTAWIAARGSSRTTARFAAPTAAIIWLRRLNRCLPSLRHSCVAARRSLNSSAGLTQRQT